MRPASVGSFSPAPARPRRVRVRARCANRTGRRKTGKSVSVPLRIDDGMILVTSFVESSCRLVSRPIAVFSEFSKGVMKLLLPALIAALLLAGCSSSDEMTKGNLQIMRSGSRPVQPEVQPDKYVIRQTDQIQVSVWGYPEFNATVPVKETGTVTIPLLGEVTAAGLTKEQFVETMKSKLAVYIQGEVKLTVTVTSTLTQKVAVLGEVSKQENYPLSTDATLIEVISAAGGTTADSDLRHIKILRGGMSRQPIEVDLTWYMQNGNVEAIPMIRPGDTVFIPKKSNVVRELSDFMRDAIFIFGFFRVFN